MTVIVIAAIAEPAVADRDKKHRTVEATYLGGNYPAVIGPTLCDPSLSCVDLEVKPGERYVEIEVNDMSGQAVLTAVFSYSPFETGFEEHQHICGRTDRRMKLARDLKVLTILLESPWGAGEGCPGIGLGGTIVAKFSR